MPVRMLKSQVFCLQALNLTLSMVSILSLLSCSKNNLDKGSKESRPVSQENQSLASTKDDEIQVARGIYDVKVRSGIVSEKDGALNLCAGAASLLISNKFTFKLSGKLECAGMGAFDLGGLSPSGPVQYAKEDMSRYPYFGMVMRTPNPMDTNQGMPIYNPPKPASLGPLIQDPKAFDGFYHQEKSSLVFRAKDGREYKDEGSFTLQVLETGSSVVPDGYTGPIKFDNILHWKIDTGGFQNVPRHGLGLFKQMELWFNMRPISIPKIIIKSRLQDLVDPTNKFSTMGAFIGELIIELNLREHQPLAN